MVSWKIVLTNVFLIWLLILTFWLIPFIILFDIVYNACLCVKQIFPCDLKKTNLKDYHLVDVRTKGEFGWFHINGATLLDNSNLENDNLPVVVICMSGHRSPIIAHKISKRFKGREVYNLYGGMLFWKMCCGEVVY